jgi:hypothetical protein
MNKIVGVEHTKLPEQKAQIKPLNGLIAIKDLIQVRDNIWKGTIVMSMEQKEQMSDTIFFDRHYDAEKNELDKWNHEVEVKAGDALDHDFLLVPKEKCLFLWEAETTILRVRHGNTPKRRRGGLQ